MRKIPLDGKKFGRWLVLNESKEKGNRGQIKWDCVCDCGARKAVQAESLKKMESRSCGCLKREASHAKTHGLSKSRIYRIYRHMVNRCNNKNVDSYPAYGGRGISVCREWGKFEAFYEWAMSNGYKDTLSIDRIDNEKGYSPENCKWSTVLEQARNKRNSKITEDIAKKVRKMRSEGVRNKDVADALGLARRTVSDIESNKTWAAGDVKRLSSPTVYIECLGERKMAHEWSKDPRVNVTSSTILRRKRRGMSDYDSLFAKKITHNSA